MNLSKGLKKLVVHLLMDCHMVMGKEAMDLCVSAGNYLQQRHLCEEDKIEKSRQSIRHQLCNKKGCY